MTTLNELTKAVCKSWTGSDPSVLKNGEGVPSRWNTEICSAVIPKLDQDESGNLIGTDQLFFTGLRQGSGDDGLAGVLVHLHDSYGNVVVRVDSFGQEYDRMSYESQFNERTPIRTLVKHIRTLVEIVAADLAKDQERVKGVMIPAVFMTDDKMHVIVDKLRKGS